VTLNIKSSILNLKSSIFPVLYEAFNKDARTVALTVMSNRKKQEDYFYTELYLPAILM